MTLSSMNKPQLLIFNDYMPTCSFMILYMCINLCGKHRPHCSGVYTSENLSFCNGQNQSTKICTSQFFSTVQPSKFTSNGRWFNSKFLSWTDGRRCWPCKSKIRLFPSRPPDFGSKTAAMLALVFTTVFLHQAQCNEQE